MGRTLEQELSLTAVAIRQGLMEYFKGDCVQRMVENPKLRWNRVDAGTGYLYQRRASNIKDHRRVRLSGVDLFEIFKEPHTMVIYKNVLSRSKELAKLEELVRDAMRKFLPGVRIVTTGTAWADKQLDDREVVKGTRIVVDGMARPYVSPAELLSSIHQDEAEGSIVRSEEGMWSAGVPSDMFEFLEGRRWTISN